MSRPALPADNVHTIQLPVAGCSIPEGTICKMYGWGETKGTDIVYSTFTAAVVYIQVSQVCNILHIYCIFPTPISIFFVSFFFLDDIR